MDGNDKTFGADNISKRTWLTAFFVILALASFTRLFSISKFPFAVFDEVYYATMASQYISGTPFVDAHPPVARLIFAGLAKIGGATHLRQGFGRQAGADRFDKIDTPYGGFPYIWLRAGTAIAGVLLVAFVMLFTLELTGSAAISLLSGALATLENSLIVQSRYILPDIFLLLFGVAGLWAFARKDRHIFLSSRWQLWLLVSAVLFSLSIGVKISGLIFVAVAWFISLKRKEKKYRSTVAFYLTAIPFIVITLLNFLHFSLINPNGAVLRTTGINKESPYALELTELRKNDFGVWRQRIAETALENFLLAGTHFREAKEHSGASKWYEWPFMRRSLTYLERERPSGFSLVVFLGNPAIWFGGLAALLYLVFRKLRGDKLNDDVFIFGYLFSLFIFAGVSRELFIYLYLPALTFLILISAAALDKIRMENIKFFRALCVFVIAGFLMAVPLTYGLMIPKI